MDLATFGATFSEKHLVALIPSSVFDVCSMFVRCLFADQLIDRLFENQCFKANLSTINYNGF
jgi:hypothetical protein